MDREGVASSTGRNEQAAAAVKQHHAHMASALSGKVEELLEAVTTGEGRAAQTIRDELVAWCRNELVPHARAEEQTLYPAARALPEGRLLIDGMLAEHQVITTLVTQIAKENNPIRAMTGAEALRVMFNSHLGKENELVLPLLLTGSGTSIADLLEGMHEVLGHQGQD